MVYHHGGLFWPWVQSEKIWSCGTMWLQHPAGLLVKRPGWWPLIQKVGNIVAMKKYEFQCGMMFLEERLQCFKCCMHFSMQSVCHVRWWPQFLLGIQISDLGITTGRMSDPKKPKSKPRKFPRSWKCHAKQLGKTLFLVVGVITKEIQGIYSIEL